MKFTTTVAAIFIGVLTLCACAAGAWAQPLTTGISYHAPLPNPPQMAEMMAAAGIKIGRTDLPWDHTELKKGEYDWSKYEPTIAALAEKGIQPMLILSYFNPLYNPPENPNYAPATPQARAAYVAWSQAAVRHFSKYNPVWEIWNEPNIGFWMPKTDAPAYTQLAEETCTGIRQVQASATIVAPGLAGITGNFISDDKTDFLKPMLANKKLMGCLNALSVHPYLVWPEGVLGNVVIMHELFKRMPQLETTPTVVITEWGFSTFQGKEETSFTEAGQASLLVRTQLVTLVGGFPYNVIYGWFDDGDSNTEREHRFGILTRQMQPKPSYHALAYLNKTLQGATLQQRLPSHKDTFLLLFKGPTGNTLVAWHSLRNHTVEVGLEGLKPDVQISASTLMGKPFKPQLNKSGALLKLKLSTNPVYINLGEITPTQVLEKTPPEKP